MSSSVFMRPMWILNITPDSFSDGGVWNSQEKEILKLVDTIKNLKFETIVDVGAESTAPNTSPITYEEEIHRFESIFFPSFEKIKKPIKLSIDTYKPQVVKEIISRLKSIFKNNFDQFVDEIFWNDVSGCLDEECIKILKSEPQLKYIACHNRILNRGQVHEHIFFADPSIDIVKDVLDFFHRSKKIFNDHNLKNKLILDPAFGFAKTRSQNWQIIQDLVNIFEVSPGDEFLIGVSRKSFLRDDGKKIHEMGQFEKALKAEFEIINKLFEFKKYKIILRTHSMDVVNFLQKK